MKTPCKVTPAIPHGVVSLERGGGEERERERGGERAATLSEFCRQADALSQRGEEGCGL